MKPILKIPLLFLALALQPVLYGQNFKILPESPNARGFAEYGKIPVDMYRGTPAIHIPLFSDDKGGGISLNYNLSTVKPKTLPTWVGLGWNLSVGGSVTRIVNSLPDELYTESASPNNSGSYLDRTDPYLTRNDWSSPTALQDFYENSALSVGNPLFYATSMDCISTPDEFNINIMGISGSFYMDQNKNWIGRTRDGHTFKVQHLYQNDFVLNEKAYYPYGGDLTSTSYTIKRVLYGFNITMDDGTKYIFGQNSNNIEFVNNTSYADIMHNGNNDTFNSKFVPTTWYIKEIIYPTGKSIKFSYERDDISKFAPTAVGYFTKYTKTFGGNSIYSNSLNGKTILSNQYNTYLKKIESDNYRIEFNKSLANTLQYKEVEYTSTAHDWYYFNRDTAGNLYKLDEINIYTPAGKKVNNIRFYYNNIPTERLHLENVVVNSSEKYSFIYNAKKLPAYTSVDTDDWNFYRGPNTNTSFNMLTATPGQIEAELKRLGMPDPEYSSAEVLEKIFYPTGGHTDFTYEQNDYSKYGNKEMNMAELKLYTTPFDQQAGGLRVKSVRKCPMYNYMDCNEVKYSYKGDNGRSSGILPVQFQYLLSVQGDNYTFWNRNYNSYQSLKDDNSICYSKITEENSGGKTEIYYTNFDTPEANDLSPLHYFYSFNATSFFNQTPFTSLSYMRGKPLKEIVYATNPLKPVRTTEYKYIRQNDYIRSYNLLYYVAGVGISMGFSDYTLQAAVADFQAKTFFTMLSSYNINFNTSFLSDKITTADGVSIKEKYMYEYDKNNLIKEEITQPDNSVRNISYTYADTPFLKDQYIVGVPLSSETTEMINGINKTLSKTQTAYPTSETDAKARNTENKALALPFDHFVKDLESLEMHKKVSYTKYDGKGNLTEYIENPDTSGNGLPVSIIWGYNQTNPIAKIEGAKYDDIKNKPEIATIISASNADAALTSGQDEIDLLNALSSLRKSDDFKNYLITTYTYDPLVGVRSITPPSGLIESYVYDQANRLQKVVDSKGAVLKEFSYNYNVSKFYNDAKSQIFQKNDCPTLQASGNYTYNVPAGKYLSLVSLEDANQMALDEIKVKGQLTANSQLACQNIGCTISALNGNVLGAHQFVTQPQTGHFKMELSLVIPANNNTWYNSDAAKIPSPCNPSSSRTITNVLEQYSGTLWTVTIDASGYVRFSPNSWSSGNSVAGKNTYFIAEYNKD